MMETVKDWNHEASAVEPQQASAQETDWLDLEHSSSQQEHLAWMEVTSGQDTFYDGMR